MTKVDPPGLAPVKAVAAPRTSGPLSTRANATEMRVPPTPVEIIHKYSLQELENIRLALEFIATGEYQAEGENLLDCKIVPEVAGRWASAITKLSNRVLDMLRDDYLHDPVAFARAKNFDNCSNRCLCGAYARLLQPIDSRSFSKTRVRTAHQSFLKKLQIKSARQNHDDGLECAEDQSWFCDSELRTYLESQN